MNKEERAQRFIDQEILWQCNELVNKLWDMYSYSIYEVAENLFDYDNIDEYGEPEAKEVFTWYLVTKYAYEKLNSINEPVYYCDDLGMYFWGRTVFGQMIIVDGTIQEIFKND